MLLWAVSPTDGKKLAEHKLDAPPVFDGLIPPAAGLALRARPQYSRGPGAGAEETG